MRIKKWKVGLAIAACICAISLAAGVTTAYMTDSGTATNTMTVGKVQIALREPNFPGNGNLGTTDLVPLQTVPKDPQIGNTGINDAIVFLKVEIPKAYVTLETETGFEPQQYRELFSMVDLDTGENGNWMQLRKDDSADDKCVYIFAYKDKLSRGAMTSALFDKVQFSNIIEQEVDRTTQNILINAYAIQANDIPDVDTATLDESKLNQIYDIYMNQSGDNPGREMEYSQTIMARYENADGTFGDYETVYEQWVQAGAEVAWDFPESQQWQAVSVHYIAANANKVTKVDVLRQWYYLDMNGRLDASGTINGNIKPWGEVSLWINGKLIGTKMTDYYQKQRYGSTFKMELTKVNDNFEYLGVTVSNMGKELITNQTIEGTLLGESSRKNDNGEIIYMTHFCLSFREK